jgi:hypothetical protein
MKLFPIGDVCATYSRGIIDDISYSYFEPNNGCSSYKLYDNLITTFEQQTIQTRKKSLPNIIINYKYDNIFDKEYIQVEHFIDKVGGGLDPFYVVDLSKGSKPSAIAPTSSTWTCSITNTLPYSITTNQKANYGFLWDGVKFKIGSVTTVTANTSVVFTISTRYGDLSSTNAKNDGLVYPVYNCYHNGDDISNFEITGYVNDKFNDLDTVGFLRSGEVSFNGKYHV